MHATHAKFIQYAWRVADKYLVISAHVHGGNIVSSVGKLQWTLKTAVTYGTKHSRYSTLVCKKREGFEHESRKEGRKVEVYSSIIAVTAYTLRCIIVLTCTRSPD